MAWRPTEYLIEGELDNTTPGKVTGWMSFAGMKEKVTFDIIFLDPPYKLLEERNPLKVIKKRGILKDGGKIILRHHFKTKFEAKYFKLIRQATIGDDILSFYT